MKSCYVVLSTLLVLSAPRPAAATPILPLGCAGTFGQGGCAPYAQIVFGTGSVAPLSGSLFEYDGVLLDYSVTGATATVHGAVDLSNGTLKAFASGIEDGNPSEATGGFVIVSGVDVFTLHNTLGSGFTSFTVVLTADGTGSIGNAGYGGQASVFLGVIGGGGGDFDAGFYQAGNNAPLGASFALLSTVHSGQQLRASDFYTSVAVETPFELSYSLRVDVSQGTTFDLSNTGHLNFELPAGVTITSMSGYSPGVTAADPAAVPEPATMGLVTLGLVAGAAALRRRARQVRR